METASKSNPKLLRLVSNYLSGETAQQDAAYSEVEQHLAGLDQAFVVLASSWLAVSQKGDDYLVTSASRF
jgi:hypothetical protein